MRASVDACSWMDGQRSYQTDNEAGVAGNTGSDSLPRGTGRRSRVSEQPMHQCLLYIVLRDCDVLTYIVLWGARCYTDQCLGCRT